MVKGIMLLNMENLCRRFIAKSISNYLLEICISLIIFIQETIELIRISIAWKKSRILVMASSNFVRVRYL